MFQSIDELRLAVSATIMECAVSDGYCLQKETLHLKCAVMRKVARDIIVFPT